MRFLIVFFTLAVFSTNILKASQDDCSDSYSSLVFDEKTGVILSETRPDKSAYPASLVKVMTLYLTFEAIEKGKLSANQSLTVSAYGAEIAAVNKVNSLKLKEGDKITVREAIQAVIVKSFNEAAVTLSEAVAGDEWEFVRLMNQKAEKLGMNDSSFRNASGLHAEGQYTTSYDLARLVMALKRDFPGYYHLFSLKEFSYRGEKYKTHNHVLLNYKGAQGLKTGFTNASGFNLISVAQKKDIYVVSILTGCSTYQKRDNLTKKLLDDGFLKVDHRKSNAKIAMKLGDNFIYKDEICYPDEVVDK